MKPFVPVSHLQETLSKRLLAQNVVLAGRRRQKLIQHLQDLNEHVHRLVRLVDRPHFCHLENAKTPQNKLILVCHTYII
jgi:hypothetical protein